MKQVQCPDCGMMMDGPCSHPRCPFHDASPRPEARPMTGAEQEGWYCWYRRNGFTNCDCARFDDGSCVPIAVYPEFAKRRDAEGPTREFAKRKNYANMLARLSDASKEK